MRNLRFISIFCCCCCLVIKKFIVSKLLSKFHSTLMKTTINIYLPPKRLSILKQINNNKNNNTQKIIKIYEENKPTIPFQYLFYHHVTFIEQKIEKKTTSKNNIFLHNFLINRFDCLKYFHMLLLFNTISQSHCL